MDNSPVEINDKIDAQNMLFNADVYNKMYCIAEAMSKANATIPDHLKGNIGDCMAILMQASLWNMSPWAVAQKTSVVRGKLMYEGQLITAVVNSKVPMHGKIRFEHFGDWERVFGKFEKRKSQGGHEFLSPLWSPEDEQGLGVKVIGHLKGEPEAREVDVLLTQCHPRNSTYWASNPKQQICYLASRVWARLNCPDVILGVYCPDEIEDNQVEMRDITPTKKPDSRGDEIMSMIGKDEVEEVDNKQYEIDLNNIVNAIRASCSIDDLNEVIEHAAKLPEEYKKQARSEYSIRRDQIKQENNNG